MAFVGGELGDRRAREQREVRRVEAAAAVGREGRHFEHIEEAGLRELVPQHAVAPPLVGAASRQGGGAELGGGGLVDGLKAHIKTIGLFNNKAKNVIALSEILMRDHAGEVPADRDALEALPGVGRKTANVVMNTAFGAETFAVDTHIFRLGNRTGIAPGKTVVAVEKALEKSTPKPFRIGAHHWLILHGRYICKARTPECWRCPVVDLCRFKPKTPAPKIKSAKVQADAVKADK